MSYMYDPSRFFDVVNLEQAMKVILTPEDTSTEERWITETPYVVDLIARTNHIDSSTVILDYGCGVGRIARELIRRYSCAVVGADISPRMRGFASIYVEDERFFSCGPQWLPHLGIKFDLVLSIWVLQHVFDPHDDLNLISPLIKPGGRMFVTNMNSRTLPLRDNRWAVDRLDVKQILEEKFKKIEDGHLDTAYVSEQIAQNSYWSLLEKSSSDYPQEG